MVTYHILPGYEESQAGLINTGYYLISYLVTYSQKPGRVNKHRILIYHVLTTYSQKLSRVNKHWRSVIIKPYKLYRINLKKPIKTKTHESDAFHGLPGGKVEAFHGLPGH